MSKRDWIEVGLKLLGVYFLVLGFTTAILTGIGYVLQEAARRAAWDSDALFASGRPLSLLSLAQPFAFLVASFFLVWRTQWCLNKIGMESEDAQLTRRST